MITTAEQPLLAIKQRIVILANHSRLSAPCAEQYAAYVHAAACQWHSAGLDVLVFDCFGSAAAGQPDLVQDAIYYLQLGLTPEAEPDTQTALGQSLRLYKPAFVVALAPEYLLAAAIAAAQALKLPLLADIRLYQQEAMPLLSSELLSACQLVLCNKAIPELSQALAWPLTDKTLAPGLACLLGPANIQSRLNPQQLKLNQVLQSSQQQAISLMPEPCDADTGYNVDDTLHWQLVKAAPYSTLTVHGAVQYETTGQEKSRKAVLLVKLLNSQAQQLTAPCAGLAWSEMFGCHFVYLADSQGKDKQVASWVLPDTCNAVAIAVRGFYLTAPAKVHLKQLRLYQDNRQALLQAQWNYINHYFYNKGDITFARSRLERLLVLPCTPEQHNLGQQVRGLYQLKQGIVIPPRQPDPVYLPRKKALLYCLHQSLPYLSNGYATRSHGIARGLGAAGWQVQVATRPGFPWDTQDVMASTSYYKQVIDGVGYIAYNGSHIEQMGLDRYIAVAADHFCREAQHHRASLIIAAANHVTALPALIAARRLGIPFVYELRGLWHLTKGALRPDWAGSENFQLEHQLELLVAAEADQVLTLTDELQNTLQQAGIDTPIALAPNAVDCDVFYPKTAEIAVRKQLDIADDVLVIGYAGSAVGYEGLDVLMEALAILARQGLDFVFVLLGDGAVLEQVQRQAGQLNISSYCRFAGRVAFADVAQYISCMDVMPVARRKCAVTDVVSALKPLEAMAMAKTLVLSDVSPHYAFAGTCQRQLDAETDVRLHQRALMCRHDDARSLASALKIGLTDAGLRAELGAAAANWITEQRSWQVVTERYSKTIQQLTEPNSLAQLRQLPEHTSKPKIAVIADEFSLSALADAAELLVLTPQHWRQQLEAATVEALLVESAWNGNQGQWYKMVGHYDAANSAVLHQLLSYCRQHKIPSLFWNKEDPVHFDRFAANAALFDHVFSSDANSLERYLALPDSVIKTVSSMAFFAAPTLHNPLPAKVNWQDSVAYGGSYYGERYAKRTAALLPLLQAAAEQGLSIYNRQHNNPDSPYRFPDSLSGYVQGGVSYPQMVQLYKAHPVHINVNSVVDSPTMFSRRVMEIAACGTPILSASAPAMRDYIGKGVYFADDARQAKQCLQRLNVHCERWLAGLDALRQVYTAHTAKHRLCLMLRTAGLNVAAPKLLPVWLLVQHMTEDAARAVLKQSVLPQRVLAVQWQAEAKQILQRHGIVTELSAEPAQTDILIVQARTADVLCQADSNDVLDLQLTTLYSPYQAVTFCRDPEPAADSWPGLTTLSGKPDFSLSAFKTEARLLQHRDEHTLLLHLAVASKQATCLLLRKPLVKPVPAAKRQQTLLIAGHDLKFIVPFYPALEQAGFTLLIDQWSGHQQHDATRSMQLLKQADVIFCEWLLGNALWYARHKLPSQRLFGRLHSQELKTALFTQQKLAQFEQIFVVAEHIRQQAVALRPDAVQRLSVLHNAVDVNRFNVAGRKSGFNKVLGVVGIVPQMKRFDLVLDILATLRKADTAYVLRVKGKLPADYSWMVAHRPDEVAWYDKQFERIANDPLLQGAVYFDEQGDDMPQWYQQIDVVLSTSDFESFHYSVAEGAACGCQPVVFNWSGAATLYPPDWCVDDVAQACYAIQNMAAGKGHAPGSLTAWVRQHYALDKISSILVKQLQPAEINTKADPDVSW